MIDYDNTYTADVNMWRIILPTIKRCGHNVYLVTSRDVDTPIELVQDFVDMKIPIVYCAYRAKRDVCREQGIDIQVWIDDDPYYINTGFVTEEVPIELIKENAKSFQG